ncbi:hypothetical protein OXPF_21340 [Oxobacter pfennigii]|uniref:Uncharacterized protein n=1 Tax=Oxobacter pfennigii TaxID=36849 RepID=A0A0P8YW86_9CLOT|nr:hypothetical protein [Oxobacter pfennigii]KPU43969.1 hypothetical protein OXPF_21340 [Oxobacter pfennigii]
MGLHYRGKKLFGLILLCLGLGMVLVLVLPFWALLAIAGVGLICVGWYYIRS